MYYFKLKHWKYTTSNLCKSLLKGIYLKKNFWFKNVCLGFILYIFICLVTSGPVLQTVVNFQTEKAVPWLGRAESLLQEAGLNPLPRIFVGGVKVKNITVGSEWLLRC